MQRKPQIFASMAWVLVVIVLAGGLLWYISANPMGPGADEDRAQKAGLFAGFLLGGGFGAIWGFAILKRIRHRQP